MVAAATVDIVAAAVEHPIERVVVVVERIFVAVAAVVATNVGVPIVHFPVVVAVEDSVTTTT